MMAESRVRAFRKFSLYKKLRNYPADETENQEIHTIVCRFGVYIGA
jgi:hypothetical protein